MSLGETMLRPTAMLFRNLLSMDVEESLRGNPIDGAVLLTGCDKTTPGSIMGAASVDLPTHGGDRRPDAERQVPRLRHRLRYGGLAVHPGPQRRADDRRRTTRRPSPACPAATATA